MGFVVRVTAGFQWKVRCIIALFLVLFPGDKAVLFIKCGLVPQRGFRCYCSASIGVFSMPPLTTVAQTTIWTETLYLVSRVRKTQKDETDHCHNCLYPV